ncbi:MAG: porin [Bacteroidales bacterium]|nr:porin [Bacteroidales bacterium]
MKSEVLACLMALTCGAASAQQEGDIDWSKELKERITINGYAQAGYTFTATDGVKSNTLDLKRTLLWAKARITDRWSFLFMTDFNSQVQEFYTDYRVTEGKELTVRFGQFKNQLSMENPLSPVTLELIDVCSQGVTYLTGCGSDPLFGVNYGRDLGIDLYGELYDGELRYNLELMNGRGINKKDLDNKKDVIVKLDWRPLDDWRFVASAQKGYATAIAYSMYDIVYDSGYPDNTIEVGETYRRNRWTIGAEYKSGPNDYWKERSMTLRAEWLAGQDKDNTSFGGYVTGSGPISGQLDWVASVDYFNYNKGAHFEDGESNYDQMNLIGGLQYWFYRKCRLQLQYCFSDPWYSEPVHRVMLQTQVAF